MLEYYKRVETEKEARSTSILKSSKSFKMIKYESVVVIARLYEWQSITQKDGVVKDCMYMLYP